MEQRSIDIKKHRLKEIEEIFETPKTTKTVIKDPLNWKGASTALFLLIIAVWSTYFVTQKLKPPATGNDAAKNTVASTANVSPPPLPKTNDDANTVKNNPFAPLDEKTTSPKESDQTSEKKDIAKDSFKIRILNGNGVTGDAAKLKTDLSGKGFSVGVIGNANLKYDKTQVYFIASKQKEAELVAQNLTNRQTEQKEAEQSLIGVDYQILVIVGKQ